MTSIGLLTPGDHRKLFQMVPDYVKETWNEWALLGLILISVASQIVLVLLGNLRKHNPRPQIRIALWCAYFLANAVPSTALGVIAQSASDVCSTSRPISRYQKLNTSELMSFWAPFLLLHLGGPDTITAYSSEDNELWLRLLAKLVVSFGAAVWILLLSLPGCSYLPFLSILVYANGFIKCFERVEALRLASIEHLRDSMLGSADPGPNSYKFLEELHLKKSQEVPELPLAANEHAYPEERGKAISEAYYLYQTFKRLFVDPILTFEETDGSQSYFCHLDLSGDAFRAVEIELGFGFDLLCTKASVVYTVRGLILRLTSVLLVLLVPVGFYFLCDMDDYQVIHIAITYLLIAAAVLMEIFAFITILCSDWTDHLLSQHNHTRNILIFPFLKQPTKRRWSRSIAQLDLVSVALEEKPASFLQIQKFLGVDKYLANLRYMTYSKVSDNLKGLIYSQFREGCSSDPKALCTDKGSSSLRKNNCEYLIWSTSKVKFDESILIWHIATALCYYSEDEDKDHVHRRESKHISDYLLHLLVVHPVMFPVGIGMIRYGDTCADAIRFIKGKGPITEKAEACRKLLEVDCLELLPSKVKRDRRKSALFDGRRLASTLREMERERMWKVMSQVWIEMLAYAATNCGGFHHAQQLQNGSEFLTHVWFLMAHLGITEQL